MTMNCLAKPTQRTARTRSTRASQRSGTLPGVSPTKVRKVPQDSCQLPGRKGFSAIPELPRRGPDLVGQFWGLDSDRILKLVLREIILSQEIQMPPGGRRAIQGLREGRCDQTQQRLLIEPETTHTASD